MQSAVKNQLERKFPVVLGVGTGSFLVSVLPFPRLYSFSALLISGSSPLICSLDSFMGFFFPGSIWTVCNLPVPRNEGQIMLGDCKVDLKVGVHLLDH